MVITVHCVHIIYPGYLIREVLTDPTVHFHKAFFLTYYNTAFFALYLLPLSWRPSFRASLRYVYIQYITLTVRTLCTADKHVVTDDVEPLIVTQNNNKLTLRQVSYTHTTYSYYRRYVSL